LDFGLTFGLSIHTTTFIAVGLMLGFGFGLG